MVWIFVFDGVTVKTVNKLPQSVICYCELYFTRTYSYLQLKIRTLNSNLDRIKLGYSKVDKLDLVPVKTKKNQITFCVKHTSFDCFCKFVLLKLIRS